MACKTPCVVQVDKRIRADAAMRTANSISPRTVPIRIGPIDFVPFAKTSILGCHPWLSGFEVIAAFCVKLPTIRHGTEEVENS